MRVTAAPLLLLAASALLPAQWLTWPTRGAPRNKDGSVNLKAPAPRAAGGRPDLSGMWLAEKNRPCPPEGCADMEIGQEFVDIGWALKDGLPLRPWAAELRRKRTAENGAGDPGSHCRPTGLIKNHTSPFYRKIVQVPGLVLIITERDASYRQIFTDGRPLPKDPAPTPNGYSIGQWHGDTLVVESAGFPDDQWLDRSGTPLTDAARITEKFRRVNYGQMEIELTVNDPKAYTRAWSIRLNQFIALDTEMLDYFCMENERDSAHLSTGTNSIK